MGALTALQCAMPDLTRRRSLDHVRQECWLIYYGDVHVGTVSERSGIPPDKDPSEWRCGFYPGSRPGEYQSGAAADLEEARAGFERAWREFLAKRTEADFQAWRDQRDWTERKYALWAAGKRIEMPSHATGKPCSRFMRCRCGEIFDMHEITDVVTHVPHLSSERK